MSYRDLKTATKVLEEALALAAQKRADWLVARVAHPGFRDVMAAEEYAEAANAVADAWDAFTQAQSDAQAEYLRGEFGEQSA